MRIWIKFTSLIIIIISIFLTSCDHQHQSGHTFLILSDIHFDPFLACQQNVQPCQLIQTLQKNPVTQWSSIFKQYANTKPSKIGQDTNDALLESTLTEMKSLPYNYDFVIIPGDFLGHNFRSQYVQFTQDKSEKDYQLFVNKVFQYLQLRLQSSFPDKKIYIALGNNDTYGANYSSDPNGSFYKNVGNIWDIQKDTFSTAGYYSITLPNQQKIIVLNSVLFFIKATGPGVANAAAQELTWLQQQLAAAKQNKQKVWLVYHIPNGIDVYYTIHFKKISPLWQQTYNQNFLQLVQQYSGTITAIMTSHIHMDGFQILQSNQSVIDTFTPAVSPIYGNNPAFKVYFYNDHTMRLTNFITYYFDEQTQKWSEEYNFNKIYQSDCPQCTIIKGFTKITKSNTAAKHYQKYYGVSTDSQYITKGFWLPYYWCALHWQTVNTYQKCIKEKKYAR